MTDPDARLDDHSKRIAALEQSDIRRASAISLLTGVVERLERETREQTITLTRIDTGIRFIRWALPSLAVVVPALWWLFQQLAHK